MDFCLNFAPLGYEKCKKSHKTELFSAKKG